MTIALPLWLGPLILLLVSGAAFWKGGSEERLTAACLLMNVTATVVLRDPSWPHLQRAAFGADLVQLAVLLWIALRSAKYWPLAAAGFHLLTVLTHIAKMIDPGLHQWAYITAIVIWTYLLIAALGVGTWNTWRRRPHDVRTDAARPAVDTRR